MRLAASDACKEFAREARRGEMDRCMSHGTGISVWTWGGGKSYSLQEGGTRSMPRASERACLAGQRYGWMHGAGRWEKVPEKGTSMVWVWHERSRLSRRVGRAATPLRAPARARAPRCPPAARTRLSLLSSARRVRCSGATRARPCGSPYVHAVRHAVQTHRTGQHLRACLYIDC